MLIFEISCSIGDVSLYLQSFLLEMANHKSAIKRIRATVAKRDLNRYQHKTARTIIKNLRNATSKDEASKLLVTAFAALDKLAKRNVIHANKAGNLKSGLQKHFNALA